MPIADTKGVTVRPLIKITGETGFNEVLFEDVVVPDTLRLDEVGKGWTVAMTTLLYERGAAEGAGSGGGVSLDERITALIALAKRTQRNGKPAWDDAVIRDRSMQLAIRAEGLRQIAPPQRASSRSPIIRCACRCRRRCCERADAGHRRGRRSRSRARTRRLYLGDAHAPDNGQWPLAYMNSYGITIAAGSNEIQRNILGERVLGLAKSK